MQITLALVTIAVVAAQQPDLPVVLKSTTRLVQVSVIAQDGKGQPVTDLKKEDFRIKVNGKDQAIKIFSMDSSGALPHAEQKLPANIFTNRLDKAGPQTGVTIILLDMLNTNWTDQIFAKAELIRYLRTLQPADHIGLYTLGASLRVLHDYTADASALLSRLQKMKTNALPDFAGIERTDAMHGDALVLDALQRGATAASPTERAFYNANRITGTLKAIEFITDHLAKTPGRKNLIWLSGGFPLTIGFEQSSTWSSSFTGEINETVRAVNDANMAIYPVDARGLMAIGGIKHQNTMEELASRTGGHAYYNSNDLARAVQSAIDDSRVTYMLGFYPADENFDAKFHKIEVQTTFRKGVHLRYRKGYFDLPQFPQDEKSRKAELADAAWSPLDASGIGILARVAVSTTPGKLEIVLVIDSRQVNLEEQSGRWVGRLDVLFLQRDNAGNQYGGLDDTLNLHLAVDTYEKFLKDGFVYSKTIDRSTQANAVRIVVRDSASGAIGSITIPLTKT